MADTNVSPFLFVSQFSRSPRSRARILPDGREILSGYRYELRRREVLKRDGFACAACGSNYQIAVHHQQKRSLGRDDRLENLITLCQSCHRAEHQE